MPFLQNTCPADSRPKPTRGLLPPSRRDWPLISPEMLYGFGAAILRLRETHRKGKEGGFEKKKCTYKKLYTLQFWLLVHRKKWVVYSFMKYVFFAYFLQKCSSPQNLTWPHCLDSLLHRDCFCAMETDGLCDFASIFLFLAETLMHRPSMMMMMMMMMMLLVGWLGGWVVGWLGGWVGGWVGGGASIKPLTKSSKSTD